MEESAITYRHSAEPHVFVLPGPDHEANDEAPVANQTKHRSQTKDRYAFLAAYFILLLSIVGLVVAVTKYVQVNRDSGPSGTSTSSEPKVARNPEYRSIMQSILQRTFPASSFLEPNSPQAQALDWLVVDDQILTEDGLFLESPYALYQRYSLMVLFFATNGYLWEATSWTDLPTVHECDFLGIECDSKGRVVALDMNGRKLRGQLPIELGSLTHLRIASFKANSLEGTIPSFFYQQLTNLVTLDLSTNDFTSTLSPDIANLSNLESLIVEQLEGLSGPLPDTITSLTLLHTLNLQNTRVSGPFFDFATLCSSLKYINIVQTRLTGIIPTSIGLLTNLESFFLEDSTIKVANIPSEIGLLTKLREVALWSTEADGGTLPAELGNLLQLSTLTIQGSNFNGTIPTELGRLTNIDFLVLEGGMLSGTVPSEIGLLTRLSYLSLFRNQLDGTLPTELGNIKGCEKMYIDKNDLYGPFPNGMCNEILVVEQDCEIIECDCCKTNCEE